MMTPDDHTPLASLVSLGCAKNTVDSERILGALAEAGWAIAEDPSVADLCLVNTCGFIQPARQETADVLNELREARRDGRPTLIVAMGCMVRQAMNEPAQRNVLSAADACIGFEDYDRVAERCLELLEGRKPETGRKQTPFTARPRLRIEGMHSAYLKVSEGCSNACRFCTIPAIRGPQVSRPIEDLVAETQELIALGAREIVLIGQDTSSYGHDLYGQRCLDELLRALCEIPDDVWFRLLYVYPRFVTDSLLDSMMADPRICPYLDMPLQHIDDDVLRRMGRGMGRDGTLRLLDRVQERMPHAALRTTFITGYPGETEEAFKQLAAFVAEGRFMHVGVFAYSEEPGTPAATEKETVPETEKQRRVDELMRLQLEVSRRKLAAWKGRDVEALVDTLDAPEGCDAVARTAWQAPEVDGVTLVHADAELHAGDRLSLRVEDALDYDLVGSVRSGRKV